MFMEKKVIVNPSKGPIFSKIHMLSGKIAENIRKSYTGGAVDMYIPKGNNIHSYDVNSLYPFVMRDKEYPIGSPTYFIGNILNMNPNAFGFFYCKITAPDNLLHPILQTHYKTKDGIRTIAPLGNWEGMYFSEELYNAHKYGYKFEVLWGYTFKKGNIFKEYVENLYSIRLQYKKSDPMNFISKLLLNSLYGRFGMDDYFTFSQIISLKDYPNFEKQEGFKESLIELIDLGDNYLVQLKNPKVIQKTNLDNGKETHNVNIAISSAVTAYARIHMSQFKNNPNLPNLYYSDTDSVYFDGPLPDHMVDPTRLGALKLEGIYDKVIFLAPKVYALKNNNGEIIKIKGLSKEAINNNNINLDSLELLLFKDYKLAFNQIKWFKNISQGNIKVLDQIYTLQATGNKRELIYNDKDILVDTKSIKIGSFD
jgi:DNA polymerase elongation subunit (family B)